ncbi:hypothetical protein SynPROS71_00291 [Synechococcus sp. PROS-7-1]|nr:hypothetical protein SynPROS71_00291 [Synechococcus sp. PROS-7-1]
MHKVFTNQAHAFEVGINHLASEKAPKSKNKKCSREKWSE